MTAEPKKWKPGIADEDWKVEICKRDMLKDRECLLHLIYILTDAGSDEAKGLAMLCNMTGRQILDGIMAHTASCRKSIEAAQPRT